MKKQWKKSGVLLLAAIMLMTGILSGCSGNKKQGETKELTVAINSETGSAGSGRDDCTYLSGLFRDGAG